MGTCFEDTVVVDKGVGVFVEDTGVVDEVLGVFVVVGGADTLVVKFVVDVSVANLDIGADFGLVYSVAEVVGTVEVVEDVFIFVLSEVKGNV